MRIAHFVQRYPPALGGSEAYFARLSRYLAAQGDRVQVWTTNALDLEALWANTGRMLRPGRELDGASSGVEVRRYAVRHWPGQRYLLKLLSFFPARVVQCLSVSCNPIVPQMWADSGRRQGIDVVHATAFPYTWPIYCALRLARRCGVPFVLTPFLHLGNPRDPEDRTRQGYLAPAMLYLLRAADRVFVQTELERAALLEAGLPAERLILLGMGVEPSECTGGQRDRARKGWNIAPDEVVIGHLANKSVEKGTVDLLRTAEMLWKTGVQFRLVLAGPEMPNFLEYWRSVAPSPALRAGAVRRGVLTEEQKRDFYAGIDLFALPSRSDSFGLVFLEAWANGVPCVAYCAGGVAEVLRDGQDGLLVECGDVTALAAALRKMVFDKDLREQLGQVGRLRVLRDHAWGPRLARVREVYRELVRV